MSPNNLSTYKKTLHYLRFSHSNPTTLKYDDIAALSTDIDNSRSLPYFDQKLSVEIEKFNKVKEMKQV